MHEAGRRLAPAILLALVVAGCASANVVEVTASPLPPTPTPTPTPTVTPTTTPTATPTPQVVFPLTGVATEDARLDDPVLAVKIDNNPNAFPHAGLDHADIVYEEVVEGGLTRLVPLFHSDVPETVGPIRSGRLLDIELLSPFHPVLVYASARAEVRDALAASDAIGLVSDSGVPPFFRDDARPRPHNLFVDTDGALARGRDLPQVEPVSSALTFGDPPDGGSEVDQLDIAMTYWQVTGWSWDESAQVYRRSTREEPYRVTGEGRVGAANVVVVLTDVSRLRPGEEYMATALEGEGNAVLLRGGRRYDVRWRKASTEAHLEFVYADGTPVPFAVGRSWIHLAPIGAVG